MLGRADLLILKCSRLTFVEQLLAGNFFSPIWNFLTVGAVVVVFVVCFFCQALRYRFWIQPFSAHSFCPPHVYSNKQ